MFFFPIFRCSSLHPLLKLPHSVPTQLNWAFQDPLAAGQFQANLIERDACLSNEDMVGLSENRENPITPNGFADHYPYTSLVNCYFIGGISHFQTISTTGDPLRKWSRNAGIHPWCFSIGDFDRGSGRPWKRPTDQSMGDLEHVAM